MRKYRVRNGVGIFYASLLIITMAAPNAAFAQETITFPSRSSDLANDSYWAVTEFSEGCCTMDFNVKRWNGSAWVGGTGNSQNNQHYDWNVPLYAPANGRIASCWRNFPDDPTPSGSQPPQNDEIFTGGNHIAIITDNSNVISLNHMRQGTIPVSLCPSNPGTEQYPSDVGKTSDKEGAWRVAAYIDPANRPRVREGQFIGRVGNSGTSGGPHLHMGIKPVTGIDEFGREAIGAPAPMKFRHGWGHRFEVTEQHSAEGWYRLRGGNFTDDEDKTIHPSPYLRRTDRSAGLVKATDTLFIGQNRAVTGTISSQNNRLKLIVWDLIGINKIKRRGDYEAGTAKAVALSKPANGYVLAAVRQSDNALAMIAYRVGATVVPVAKKLAGKIGALAVATTSFGNKRAVTAVRTQSGALKVIVWDIVVANDGSASVVRLGEVSAGAVSAVAISRARNFNGVFVAVRDSNQELKVIPYQISTDGLTVTPRQPAQAGKVGTAIAVAPLAQGVAAGMRDSSGKLRIITWKVSSSGNISGPRRDTVTAGTISEISLLTAPLGDSNLTSVVRSASGKLLLIGWAVNGDGTGARRLGSSDAGSATKISADIVARSYPGLNPRDMILTSVRTGGGDLKLITWDTNLVNP